MGRIRIRYMSEDGKSDTGVSFLERQLEGDTVREVEFLTPERYGRAMRYGGVMIRFAAPGGIILGADGTWLEWDGVRYETMDDYRLLRMKVESCKMAELMEKM